MNSNILPFYNPDDKFVVKSKGCYQYDSLGKEYIDFESGVWCANIGHGNDRIIELMTRQVKESVHHGYRFRNQYAEKLSDKLLELTGLETGSSVFLSSGSEAVNLAITLARHLTGRRKILKVHNSYLSAFGFGRISDENGEVVTAVFNDPDSVSGIDFSEVAAFVMETGGASVEMVKIPDEGFIRRLVDDSQRNGCLIIANEVTTGIGRMGKWFGFQYYDVAPDMVVTGKGLGNGYPVSAVTVNKDVQEGFMKMPFRYAQSHQNDPLGCAIGLEVLNSIEENNLIEEGRKSGEYFREKLEVLKNDHPGKVREVRARGLMLALELNSSHDNASLGDQLYEEGFIVGYKLNTLRFLPPLTIKETDIDRLIEKLDELLTE